MGTFIGQKESQRGPIPWLCVHTPLIDKNRCKDSDIDFFVVLIVVLLPEGLREPWTSIWCVIMKNLVSPFAGRT